MVGLGIKWDGAIKWKFTDEMNTTATFSCSNGDNRERAGLSGEASMKIFENNALL